MESPREPNPKEGDPNKLKPKERATSSVPVSQDFSSNRNMPFQNGHIVSPARRPTKTGLQYAKIASHRPIWQSHTTPQQVIKSGRLTATQSALTRIRAIPTTTSSRAQRSTTHRLKRLEAGASFPRPCHNTLIISNKGGSTGSRVPTILTQESIEAAMTPRLTQAMHGTLKSLTVNIRRNPKREGETLMQPNPWLKQCPTQSRHGRLHNLRPAPAGPSTRKATTPPCLLLGSSNMGGQNAKVKVKRMATQQCPQVDAGILAFPKCNPNRRVNPLSILFGR